MADSRLEREWMSDHQGGIFTGFTSMCLEPHLVCLDILYDGGAPST